MLWCPLQNDTVAANKGQQSQSCLGIILFPQLFEDLSSNKPISEFSSVNELIMHQSHQPNATTRTC